MYWYFKYPIILFLLAIVFGISYLIYQTVKPEEGTQSGSQKPETTEAEEQANSSAEASGKTSDEESDKPRDTKSTEETSEEKTREEGASKAQAMPKQVKQRLKAGRIQFRKGNLEAARKLAEKACEDSSLTPFSPAWEKAVEFLGKVNIEIFTTPARVPEKTVYQVEKGDTLIQIARQFGTSVEAIQNGNNLDSTSDTIYPGKTLLIYEGDWSIEVIKEEYALCLRDGEQVFKVYDVGLGKNQRTPTGIFKIKPKLREPDWTRGGKTIPYGDPRNVLGTRWLGLQPIRGTDQSLTGYGIHGTWEPSSIGKNVSNGCIRMHNNDVEELFSIVPTGTKVTIKEAM